MRSPACWFPAANTERARSRRRCSGSGDELLGVPRLAERAVWHAALGPSMGAGEAPVSFARARAALALQQAGVLPDGQLVLASEHLLTLLLHSDPSLTTELAARCLAPLRELPPRARERLESTLLAWLRHRGNVPAAAAELHVHRQTVRYRLGRLRELLGDALEAPDRRLELELALRVATSQRSAGGNG